MVRVVWVVRVFWVVRVVWMVGVANLTNGLEINLNKWYILTSSAKCINLLNFQYALLEQFIWGVASLHYSKLIFDTLQDISTDFYCY